MKLKQEIHYSGTLHKSIKLEKGDVPERLSLTETLPTEDSLQLLPECRQGRCSSQ